MSKKMMLLATALTALAFAALPAVASAGTPQIHCPSGSTCSATLSGGHGELTKTGGFASVTCTSTTGTATIGTEGGTMQLLFHGCKDSVFGAACTTSGQTSGTITTKVLPYDNTYLTAGKTVPGVLVTPEGGGGPEKFGTFATFSCIDGNHTVTGNGVMGRLETGCNSPQASLPIQFEQTQAGHQTHKQITGTGAIYDLTDGSATAAMNTTGTATATGGGNFTITCV